MDRFCGACGPVRVAPGRQQVEQDPEREDVGTPIDRLATDLFGRHVRELALHLAGFGATGDGIGRLCDPEIDEFDVPA